MSTPVKLYFPNTDKMDLMRKICTNYWNYFIIEVMKNKNIDDIVSSMSLKDKISLCSGKDFWQTKEFEKYGIPSVFMSDGPHGLRKQEVLKGSDMLGLNESLPAACLTGMEHCQVLCPAMFTPMFISRSYRKVNSVS